MSIKYTDYLEATLPGRRAALNAQYADIQEQVAKNLSAPVVSGGSGGMVGGSASAQQLSNNFKTVGGKVVPIKAGVSQGWGKSRIKYAAGRHTGVDFGAPVGTRVNAAGNGIVSFVGSEGAYGRTVRVRHPDGSTSLYGHLSGANVKPGQRVKAGQQIARSGNTGRSTGAHLHFEIRTRDRYGSDINPRDWLSR